MEAVLKEPRNSGADQNYCCGCRNRGELHVPVALHRFFKTVQQQMNGGAVALAEVRTVDDEPRPAGLHDAGDLMEKRDLLLHAEDIWQLLHCDCAQS